jgi:uncharacterized LabA/DUF88 family protein
VFFLVAQVDQPAPIPERMKAIAFVDGQNLFYAAQEAFDYHWPNFDPAALTKSICDAKGWDVTQVRVYTGMPERSEDPFWHHFWSAKKTAMTRQGVYVYTRPLRYRDKSMLLDKSVTFRLPDGQYLSKRTRLFDLGGREVPPGTEVSVRVGEEKGIDIRIALDVISLARESKYDVAIIFSQDQDLSEVVDEVIALAKSQGREIKLASAYPDGTSNKRGINKTDWIRIDKATYDKCIDPRDYRPKKN